MDRDEEKRQIAREVIDIQHKVSRGDITIDEN